MTNHSSQFRLKATGIGSVPWTDINRTCSTILKQLPHIPFWPQFVQRSYFEDMIVQFSEGLPSLQIHGNEKRLTAHLDNVESELVTFYDHYLKDDLDYFAISREYACGLSEMVRLISQEPDRYGPYIKGQTVGPVTFAAAIKDPDGFSIIHHPDLVEATTKGLAMKALWQVKELSKTTKKPIIFIDEPYLSGFGSAFSPIERDDVIRLLKEVIDYLRDKSDACIGIHCCGNTDWSMIIETGPDILNFDAFSYMDYFLLYPEDITRFIQNGGTIAWGIVPTSDFSGNETIEGLFAKLKQGLARLYEWGLEPVTIANQSLLTPACGLGTMDPVDSEKVLNLLSGLSRRCHDLD
ncbi:MAG: hypothetical protein JW932_02445 [Deltaproteobacteria bacterium]|nr:hypothetical protein [Deltaproteobacteria bacterium]